MTVESISTCFFGPDFSKKNCPSAVLIRWSSWGRHYLLVILTVHEVFFLFEFLVSSGLMLKYMCFIQSDIHVGEDLCDAACCRFIRSTDGFWDLHVPAWLLYSCNFSTARLKKKQQTILYTCKIFNNKETKKYNGQHFLVKKNWQLQICLKFVYTVHTCCIY